MTFRLKFNSHPLSSIVLITLSALFVTSFANLAFFRNYLAVYGGQPSSLVHFLSLALLLFAAVLLLLSLTCWPAIQKSVLTVVFLMSAAAAYFMDTYNVVIDSEMISSVMATDAREIGELVTLKGIAYLFLLGILPSGIVWLLNIRPEGAFRAVVSRLSLAGVSFLVVVAVLLSSLAFYSSYLRENKTLRYYANPLTPVYSFLKSVEPEEGYSRSVLQHIGLDAEIPPSDVSRELVVMVVGETARADRFSLNGYERDTNPELSRLDVVSFSNVSACGTSTVVSVPCMFSMQNRSDFDEADFESSENILDVLEHAGVNILWRDNNSSSKGVAMRVPEEDFRTSDVNPECDAECRDTGMLDHLQEFIDGHPSGDILIVLHQMGSHGPAYFRRYPQQFARFQPSCETSMLDNCSEAEIGNSYDNTILYTDHFLASVIEFLKTNDDHFETVMFYVSDHGESLGESGVYLHGYPYAFAPDEQIRVPMIMWFGRNYDDVDPAAVETLSSMPLSHDNIFHILLGLFEIESDVYDPSSDVLQLSRGVDGSGSAEVSRSAAVAETPGIAASVMNPESSP